MKSKDGRFEIEHERTDSHEHFLLADYETRLIDHRTGQRIVLVAETVASPPTDGRFSTDGREIVLTRPDGSFERHTLPVLIEDCLLWLRADLGLSIDTDITIIRWEDQSGNGVIAKGDSANHSMRPTYNASPINRQPTLRFDATKSQSLSFDPAHAIPSSVEVHAFVVHRVLRRKGPLRSNAGFWTLFGGAAGMPLARNVQDDCYSTTSHNCGAPIFALTNPHVYEVVSTATKWANRLNGIPQFSTADNTVAWQPAGACIGKSSGPTYYHGDWAEMVLYGRALAADDRALLINYFNRRYGLGTV